MENEKRIQIIRAAAKRFARNSISKTTLDEIARDLRISKASLYYYFESKDRLFYETVRWDGDQFVEELKSIFNNESLQIFERFGSYFALKDDVQSNHKLLFDLILKAARDNINEKEIELYKNFLQKEEQIIKLALSPVYAGRIETMNPELPSFVVMTSWGLMFGNKLRNIEPREKSTHTSDMIQKTLQVLFS
ncbi:MAG: TetR/AcrR family transcriptional regulator [Ignavibacteriales bacterium]|nr:TetR/AcrR family transcriptional regulator [Ignavibacteriales bacterium]